MPAEVARRILSEGQYLGSDATRSADVLIRLARQPETDLGSWNVAIVDADTATLIAALGGLGGGLGARADSFRDAIRSEIERRLAESMIERMEALERASTRLGQIGIAVGAVVGIAGLLVAL